MDINENWFNVKQNELKVQFEPDLKVQFEQSQNELKEKIIILEHKVEELFKMCHHIENNNLKLTNRILENEVILERTKNILLRKNISFPFMSDYHKFFNDKIL